MNWEALGAIGEIVGAVAVVMTLGYLAVQIRQNTKAVRRSSHQSAVEGFANTNVIMMQDPELCRIVNTGTGHPEELDRNELTRFDRWVAAHMTHMENLFFQHRDGIVETERWMAYEVVLREFLVMPGIAQYWEKARHRYTSTYQEFIERLRSS